MEVLILNDVHLGAQRVAGTTPATQAQIRQYLRESFRDLIMQHTDKMLVISGDLFDGFTIDTQELLNTYMILSEWLALGGMSLVLGAGNHDIGKREDRMSSFGLLASLLKSRYNSQVTVVDKHVTTVRENIHVVPHCMNQDLFNLELETAYDLAEGFLLIHANVDNNFAVESDHSLNVNEEMLRKLSKRHTLIFAHEHQNRVLNFGDNDIIVTGNQWPSSVADCIAHGAAQKDGKKYAHVITEDNEVQRIETWAVKGDFEQVRWTDLAATETEARFIRVVGEAEASQASDVVSLIAKYRTKSEALVITNAVKIAGVKGMDELAEASFEQVTTYDVFGALLELLEPKEQEVVKGLLND